MDKLFIRLLLVACLSLAFGTPVLAASVDGVFISSVVVTGLDRLDEDVVLAGLTIKPGDTIVANLERTKNQAAQALYETGWFAAMPQLDFDLQDGKTVLRVKVEENPPYKGTTIEGNELFPDEELLALIENPEAGDPIMVPGEVFNRQDFDKCLDRIADHYAKAGYIGVGFSTVNFYDSGERMGWADITIREGVIDEIIITGLENTREHVAMGRITHLEEGELLTRENLEKDLERLYNTGLFESVVPDIQPSLKENHLRVVFEVVEAPTGQAGFGLGYSTVQGLQGSVSYSERNLWGSGKHVEATVLFSRGKPGFEVTYTDPYLNNNSFWGVNVFDYNSLIQRYQNSAYEAEMETEKIGGNVFYGQHLSDTDSWQVSAGIADYDYRVLRGDPFSGTDARHRSRMTAEGETRKMGLGFTRDTRDNIFDTHEGFYGRIFTDVAGFGGDFNFNKWTLETREFYEIGPGTLGMRQRVGAAFGDVPIYEEWRLGGVMSIRGVSEDLLYGTHHMLTNFEYRVKLTDMFGAVAFVDAGWAGDDFGGMDNALGAGIGARIKIPKLGLGAIRLDYGWELAGEEDTNNRFHFFIGEMF